MTDEASVKFEQAGAADPGQCVLCGLPGRIHALPATPGASPRGKFCRRCVRGMYAAAHPHDHNFAEDRSCPVCARDWASTLADGRYAPKRRDREVVPCRFRVIRCHESGPRCAGEALVDVGLGQDGYPLPRDWVVLDVSIHYDVLRFVCGSCRATGG